MYMKPHFELDATHFHCLMNSWFAVHDFTCTLYGFTIMVIYALQEFVLL